MGGKKAVSVSPSLHPPRRILVTGGGGFLGYAIVKQLAARGDNVRSFSRHTYEKLAEMNVDQIQGDIANRSDVAEACRDCDMVFHTAAKPGVWGRYKAYYHTNVVGTRNIIDACRNQHIRFLIHTSSPSVIFNGRDMEGVDESVPYPDRYDTHYQKTKAIAERMVRSASDDRLHTVILRPHLIWGPEDNHLVPRIIARADSLFQVGNGENLVDTVYIDNAAAAHLLAADRLTVQPDLSGRAFFISQDKPVKLWDMINCILKAGGREPVKRAVSRRTAWWIGAFLEGIYAVLRIRSEPKMTRFVADELATSHWFDISAARRDLGYRPAVTIDEGLSRLASWLDKQER